MNVFRLILFSLVVALLSACAQVEVTMPNPRVESPETRGEEYKWKFIVAGGDAHVYKATENGGERPPDLTRPGVRGHADVYPGATFTPWMPLEVGAEANFLGKGLGVFAKWQLFGEGSSAAKKGNIPVAVFARAGGAYGSKNGDQTSFGGDGGYDWRGQINAYYTQAGASVGYRASDRVLVYTGVAIAEYANKTKISQDPNSTDTIGGSYETGENGDGKSAALGVMFTWPRVQFYFSGAYTRVDYGPTDDMEGMFLHTGVNFTP